MENKILTRLQITPEILNWASDQNVEGLRQFLITDIDRPLICIGSGGSYTTCVLITTAYGVLGGFAKAVTPYLVYSLSESLLAKSKVLLVSNSGHNKDIVTIAKLSMKINPKWTANLSTSDGPRNYLKAIISHENSFNYKSDIEDDFISVNSVIANYALVLKAFGVRNIPAYGATKLDIPDFSGINHLMVLHGGWGESAAIDFESKLVESGTATCAVSDYRNFCHGRFILPGNHSGHEKKTEIPADCAIVMLTTPREKPFADKVTALFPNRCKIVNVHTDAVDSTASLDLLLKVSVLAGDIASSKGINPLSPKNYSNIDKRKPLQIPFIKEIKDFGALKI